MVERYAIRREDFASTKEEKMPYQTVARVALVILCGGPDSNSETYAQSVVSDGKVMCAWLERLGFTIKELKDDYATERAIDDWFDV